MGGGGGTDGDVYFSSPPLTEVIGASFSVLISSRTGSERIVVVYQVIPYEQEFGWLRVEGRECISLAMA